MQRMRPELGPFLDRLASHSPLSDAERRMVLQLPGPVMQVAANRDIVRSGDVVDHVCVIADGVASSCGQSIDGARQITAFHLPGDAPDLRSVALPRVQLAVQAVTATTVVRVPHAALRHAAAAHPGVAEAFRRDCALDMAIMAEWLVNIGLRSALARIAHLLCEMAVRRRAPVVGGSASFAFPVTQIHIAEATGLTPVHVNRTLRALRERGLLDLRSGTVRIADWRGLVRAGDFRPDYLRASGTDPSESLPTAA